jgi:hypothetical protein
MGAGRRSLLLAAVGAAMAFPAAASAAPVVTGSAVPGMPQDCQAGCIGSLKMQCTATDPLSVRTTVSCWTRSYDTLTSTQDLPAAFVSGTVYNPIIGSFTFCVQGTARYADGTTATTLRCAPGTAVGAVAG